MEVCMFLILARMRLQEIPFLYQGDIRLFFKAVFFVHRTRQRTFVSGRSARIYENREKILPR